MKIDNRTVRIGLILAGVLTTLIASSASAQSQKATPRPVPHGPGGPTVNTRNKRVADVATAEQELADAEAQHRREAAELKELNDIRRENAALGGDVNVALEQMISDADKKVRAAAERVDKAKTALADARSAGSKPGNGRIILLDVESDPGPGPRPRQ